MLFYIKNNDKNLGTNTKPRYDYSLRVSKDTLPYLPPFIRVPIDPKLGSPYKPIDVFKR